MSPLNILLYLYTCAFATIIHVAIFIMLSCMVIYMCIIHTIPYNTSMYSHDDDLVQLVWVESCTNPLLKVIDVRNLVKLVKSKNKDIIVMVDNTFMTPYFLRPLDMGADLVLHSVTKYLNGVCVCVCVCVCVVYLVSRYLWYDVVSIY